MSTIFHVVGGLLMLFGILFALIAYGIATDPSGGPGQAMPVGGLVGVVLGIAATLIVIIGVALVRH